MANDLSIQKAPNAKQQMVITRKNEIASMESDLKKMLPPSLPSDKFIRTVQTAITLNPDLAECDKTSVLASCMKAAADGLVLDGREATLTIYNAKRKDGSYKKLAQYIPMVAGVIKRVRNSGEVGRLNAFVVYANDTFKVAYGLEMTLKHEPNFADPGKPIGAYAVCLFKDGEIDFEFMSLQQIDAIKARSKSSGFGPWVTDWSEMARKTVIRRLSKRLPVDSDIARVVQQIDEDYDMKPSASSSYPVADEDGVIEHEIEEKAPPKARGAAASKLNPKPTSAEPSAAVEQDISDVDDVELGGMSSDDDGLEDVM